MTSFHSRTEITRDDWQTPLSLERSLGSFDLDPCANIDNPMRVAIAGFTLADNGLYQRWSGRVFMNPPYGGEGGAKIWMKKLAEHGNGIALIPPRLGAKWFHDIVLSTANAILFLRGRIAFIDPSTALPVKGNNADSILVAYGRENITALEQCALTGKLWRLKKK